MKRIPEGVARLARSLWSVIGPLLTASAICLAMAFVIFGLTSFSVINESGRDLKDVTLQRYSIDGDRGVIWTEDLDRNESEWRYTYPGNYGVLLRFELEGKGVRHECKYDSGGAGRAVALRIEPEGTVSCWYD